MTLSPKSAGWLLLAVLPVTTALAQTPPRPLSDVLDNASVADWPSDKPAASNVRELPADESPIPVAPSSRPTSLSADDVAVNADQGTVEIHVNDADLVEVLRMLSMQSQRNIIASKQVKGTVTANLYGVTVREALDALLHSNGYVYREEGNFIYVYTAEEMKAQADASRVRRTEVFRLHYTPADNAVVMIKPVLSASAEVAFSQAAGTGITSGVGESGGNAHAVEDMIVITDFEDNLAEVRRVMKEIDARPQQILVEATILRAAISEDNALGFDFNVLAGVNFNAATLNSGAQITNGTVGAGTPGRDAGSIGTGNSFSSTVPNGLKVGVVLDNISVFLSALEGITDTTILANPKILALNKQKGEVVVGREDGYVTSSTTETSTIQTVEFLQTGTRLIFRPYIGNDGYIRMEIHPEDSSGGLTSANLPFKITTEVTTNILVQDGHTIVIGGLFREDQTTTRSQVPFFGNIPVAGALFRNQRDRTTREEIIIMLTPHIVKDDNAYAKLSDEESRRMNQLRVGVRRGMMPWGRERLAESFYNNAVNEMAKPNPSRGQALFNLNAATNLNPKFLEAIELKQNITGREMTAVDNSSVRSFVRRAIERDIATPPVAIAPLTAAKPALSPMSPAMRLQLELWLASWRMGFQQWNERSYETFALMMPSLSFALPHAEVTPETTTVSLDRN